VRSNPHPYRDQPVRAGNRNEKQPERRRRDTATTERPFFMNFRGPQVLSDNLLNYQIALVAKARALR
jgi:hypothetical protein